MKMKMTTIAMMISKTPTTTPMAIFAVFESSSTRPDVSIPKTMKRKDIEEGVENVYGESISMIH